MEQKGMTFDHDFLVLHYPFLFPPKKRGKRKGEWSSKNRDQKSYLSVPSKGRKENNYQIKILDQSVID